jgi:hypothetical protein
MAKILIILLVNQFGVAVVFFLSEEIKFLNDKIIIDAIY